jgi:hypothetical protein
VALAVGYLASAAISTNVVAPHSYNEDDRAYVEGLRADLRADPRAVIFDGAPPDNVMVSWFGGTGRISTVVGSVPEAPVFDLPSYSMRVVDSTGRLRSINLVGTVADEPTDDRQCGHRVTADGVTRVPLTEPAETGKQLARISYYTSASGFLVVSAGDDAASLPLRQDPSVGEVVVQGPFDHLELRLDGPTDASAGATVCVVDVLVGFPTPG